VTFSIFVHPEENPEVGDAKEWAWKDPKGFPSRNEGTRSFLKTLKSPKGAENVQKKRAGKVLAKGELPQARLFKDGGRSSSRGNTQKGGAHSYLGETGS